MRTGSYQTENTKKERGLRFKRRKEPFFPTHEYSLTIISQLALQILPSNIDLSLSCTSHFAQYSMYCALYYAKEIEINYIGQTHIQFKLNESI